MTQLQQQKLKILDLFSGIGGFSLGLHSTGLFETIKFVEKDPYCIKVLNKNFPNIPIEEDIKNVKGKEFEADVITGGFPCQPMSVAGKQKGTSDDRYLWPDMFRLIREVKPQFVIGENVQGIINIQDGMVLRQVQDDLESEDFEVQCFLIPASGIGAWHKRNRVWIIGYSEHNGSSSAKIKGRNIETATGSQERQNETSELEKTNGSRNNEDVSNSSTIRRSNTTTDNTQDGQKEFSKEDVKLGIKSSLSSNVSNSESKRTRSNNSRLWQRSSRISGGKSSDVSNTKEKRLQRSRGEESNQNENRMEQGEKRKQGKIWSKSERCGGTSNDVANTSKIRSSSESIRNSRSLEEESSREKETGNQSSVCIETRSAERGKEEKNVSNSTSGRFKKCEPSSQEKNDSSKTCEDVSNTDSTRSLKEHSATIDRQNKRDGSINESSSRRDKETNVPNSDSRLRRGRGTIRESGENKIWSFYPEKEEQTEQHIRSQTIGCDVVFGEKQNVAYSDSERQQEQCRAESIQKKRDESQCSSWWQIESSFRGVPNGISYGLDKGRVNRIKGLGNAIVPQIAREIGLAIKKVLYNK